MATSVWTTSCLRAEGKERGGRYKGTFEGYQNPGLVNHDLDFQFTTQATQGKHHTAKAEQPPLSLSLFSAGKIT